MYNITGCKSYDTQYCVVYTGYLLRLCSLLVYVSKYSNSLHVLSKSLCLVTILIVNWYDGAFNPCSLTDLFCWLPFACTV